MPRASTSACGTVQVMRTILVALGETDCETITEGVLAQPVNAVSSLAFSVVGIGVIAWAHAAHAWERRLRLVLGLILVLTGIGSFLYHGPQGMGSLFAHDVTFLAVLAVVGGTHLALALRWDERAAWAAIVGVITLYVVVLVLWPSATNVLTASAVMLVVAGDVPLHRLGGIEGAWYGAALVMMGLAVTFFLLGRSGGPICDPESVFQGHGLWHMLTAGAIGAYIVGMAPAREQLEPQ